MPFNLTQISDGLSGPWWEYISNKFEYRKVYKSELERFGAYDGDILIHKEIQSGQKFPTRRYHFISAEGESLSATDLLELPSAEIRKQMGVNLLHFIATYQRLPEQMQYDSMTSKGIAVFKFAPSKWDSFEIRVDANQIKFPVHYQENLGRILDDFIEYEESLEPIVKKTAKKTATPQAKAKARRAEPQFLSLTAITHKS